MAYDAASSIYDVSIWDAIILQGSDASVTGHSAKFGKRISFGGSAASLSTTQSAMTVPKRPTRFTALSATLSAVQVRVSRMTGVMARGPGCGHGISGGSGALQIARRGYVPSLRAVISEFMAYNLHMRS